MWCKKNIFWPAHINSHIPPCSGEDRQWLRKEALWDYKRNNGKIVQKPPCLVTEDCNSADTISSNHLDNISEMEFRVKLLNSKKQGNELPIKHWRIWEQKWKNTNVRPEKLDKLNENFTGRPCKQVTAAEDTVSELKIKCRKSPGYKKRWK